MSQPPDKYDRIFDFTDFSAMQPSAQQPGQKIDQELNAARVSINETIDRLNEIQRDDGKLRATAVDTSEFQGIVDTATATATAAATSAATSATTATTKAGEATASATTASNAATTATGASASAQAQATIASTSATTATTKATEASNSAAAALASQTSATASAATATTKAAEASGSAATAATQASNAANSANTSSAQANLATASAVAAGNSASTASAQAIAASNSASAASSSASAAAASAASFSLAVGSVASGVPGSTPVVTVTGSTPSYLLNFTLPAGDPVTSATITSALGYTPGNPANYALLNSPAFTGNVTIATNSSNPALVITQDGAGDIIQFKDVTSDTTYSFIDANGKVNTIASTTANAGFRIPVGPAPTAPIDGDIWASSIGLVIRLSGVSQIIPTVGLNNVFTGVNTFTSTLNYSGSNSNYGTATGASTIGISVGATTGGSTKNLNLGTGGLAGSFTNVTIGSTTGTSTTTLQGITNAPTASVNTNSTQIATTAFVRDMLMDGTWSAPPISTTTTATSGTGAAYVNVPPDYGYLVGPNANLAGFCQKSLAIFARSNSTYGFNLTKEIRIACKIAASWSSAFTAITQTLFFRLNTGTTNGTLSQRGFGISIDMATKVLSILAHDGTTLTTKATSWAVPFAGIASVDFMVKSDGTGTVYAYADGVLIDSTTGMSTLTASVTTNAVVNVEINSAGGTSTANATSYISNLRTFVAHG